MRRLDAPSILLNSDRPTRGDHAILRAVPEDETMDRPPTPVRIPSPVRSQPPVRSPSRPPPRARKALPVPDLNRLVVSSYKVVGFAILTLIVLGLMGFLVTNAFFFVSRSWVEPLVISPSDDRVLELNTRYAEQATLRDRLVAELRQADRIITFAEAFQIKYDAAFKVERERLQSELIGREDVRRSFVAARREMDRTNRSFAEVSKRRLQRQWDSRLIDQDGLLAGSYSVAQMATARASLAEKEVDLKAREVTLQRGVDALGNVPMRGGITYEVVRMQQEYARIMLELAQARDTKDALGQSVEKYNQLLTSIVDSPYLRAANHQATVAFVPYDNLSHVSAGSGVYACALKMVVCHRVGEVVALFPSEATGRSPQSHEPVRGQMIELHLTQPDAANEQLLFAGRPPLLF